MKFNEKTDLTRWNRAGLSAFRYVDGNAITYLEALRQQLVEAYDLHGNPSWQELLTRWPELPQETRKQARERLHNQYYDERRDYAWEILRTLARSAHVLGEYTDAYANEAYLPTAVEWDNVRRLVAMLGYRPAPPASARTYLALLYKDGESGEVDKGFAVKNKPKDGAPTVVFETLAKLDGSSELNQLYLKDWDKNFSSFGLGKNIDFPLQELPDKLQIGDLGVLANNLEGLPVKVTGIDTLAPALSLQVLSDGQVDADYRYYNTSLYLQPAFVAAPLPNGDGSALLEKSAALDKDELIFVKQGASWQVRRMQQNELRHIQLDGGALNGGGKLYRAQVLNRQYHENLEGGAAVYVLPHGESSIRGIVVDESLNVRSVSIKNFHIHDDDDNHVETVYYITGSYGAKLFYPAKDSIAEFNQADLSAVRFAGKAKDIQTGGWALVTHQNGDRAAYEVAAIDQDEAWFEVDLPGVVGAVELLRSAFKFTLRPRDYDVNGVQAWSSASTEAVTVVELDDAALTESLTLGRRLICAGEGFALAVELKDLQDNDGVVQLQLAPPFHLDPQAAGLTRHDCTLYGNAVLASHGETQPEKILGNGDASQTRQRFELPSDKISWVADAGFASGVRADLTLRVGDRVWQQVEDLAHSGPEDAHYQVKVNEDGVLAVLFGDGRNGRRLPTGVDNVRVRFRTGYGDEGNLAPFSLEKIAKPHRLIEAFVAPLASSGGAEKESAESMRASAPATVLALERAVSLDDFTHLAAHHSMVWQAKAFEKMPDRPARPLIEVVVVPAGGSLFTAGSETALTIQGYLEQHSVPGTPVSVVCYAPVLLALSLSIMVDESAFDKKQVEQAVREHLIEGLALKQRKLGQPLFRSEVIALLEEVEGVENGHCSILDAPYPGMDPAERPRLHPGDDGGIRRVSVKPDQLLYLDIDVYPLTVTTVPYEL
jgi:hypothetical protein